MNPQAAQQYLKTQVMTATPEQLQMMLFDGALRFGQQARGAIEARNFEEVYNSISKMQKIVTELSCNLRHDMAPELCAKLSALYTFAYRRLVDANINHDLKALEEAVEVVKYQRETWAMVMEKLAAERGGVKRPTGPAGGESGPLSMTG